MLGALGMHLRGVLTESPRSQQLGIRQVEAEEVTAVIGHGRDDAIDVSPTSICPDEARRARAGG
jgi:hypothetical protein